MDELKNFDFVEDEGFRLRIYPRKTNSYTLNKVLVTLRDNGYIFYQLFTGSCIFAEKR